MAYFAKLDDNNIVLQVIAVGNTTVNDLPFPESEPVGIAFCQSLFGADTNWRQTSYNNNFRFRYAGIGYNYDPVLDAFITPKPYPSWLLNTQTCDWVAPIPYPNDGNTYFWNETTQSWDLFTRPQQG